jgi:hypothetical protein
MNPGAGQKVGGWWCLDATWCSSIKNSFWEKSNNFGEKERKQEGFLQCQTSTF